MRIVGAHPEAQDELDHALARSHDPIAFQDQLDGVLADIASGLIVYPRFFPTVARECPLSGLPYSLIYTDVGREVRVIAIAHHKRQPGYWKRRLRRN